MIILFIRVRPFLHAVSLSLRIYFRRNSGVSFSSAARGGGDATVPQWQSFSMEPTARANITSFFTYLPARSLTLTRNRYGGRSFPRPLLSLPTPSLSLSLSDPFPPCSVTEPKIRSCSRRRRRAAASALINKADLTTLAPCRNHTSPGVHAESTEIYFYAQS